jgi:HPt (histidine-containing phosphotransfer) domain-containing protein
MPAIKSEIGELTCASAGRSDPAGAFDLAALLRRSMNDRALAARLVEKFTARLEQSVQDIERLLAQSDWQAAASKVHALKGEAGSLAAIELHAATTKLEHCLRAGRHAEAPVLLREVQAIAAHCLAASSPVLSRLGHSPEAASEHFQAPPCAP